MKQFPIMVGYRGTPGPCPSSIPWEAIAPYDGQAKYNHGGQSLERLAERGGLSPLEAYLVMTGRCWSGIAGDQYAPLTVEACTFLDKIVRESQIAKIAKERDDALLQVSEYRKTLEQMAHPDCELDVAALISLAREAVGEKRICEPECTCSIDGTPYCKARGTGYCKAENPSR